MIAPTLDSFTTARLTAERLTPEHRDEIASYIYSALLDVNTCEACAAADGQESESEDGIPAVPNPDCDGGDKCRCVVVAVFKDEVRN